MSDTYQTPESNISATVFDFFVIDDSTGEVEIVSARGRMSQCVNNRATIWGNNYNRLDIKAKKGTRLLLLGSTPMYTDQETRDPVFDDKGNKDLPIDVVFFKD